MQARAAVLLLQAHCRGLIARHRVADLRRRHAAATAIQAAWRCQRARRHYAAQRQAVTVLQAAARGLAARKAFKKARLPSFPLTVSRSLPPEELNWPSALPVMAASHITRAGQRCICIGRSLVSVERPFIASATSAV